MWQVVGSLPTIPSSGLPTIATPSPTLTYPSGVATTSSGDLVVADSGNNLVRVFDASTGAEKLRLPLTGSASLSWPTDVKVDACGHILVTDYGHDALRVFDSDGNDLGSITGTNPSSPLSSPWGLALSPGTVAAQSCTVNGTSLPVQGEIAVVNSGSGDVNVYNGDLSSKLSFNSTGGTSQLQAPIAVAIDSSTGDFFVSDSGVTPKAIDVYSSAGTFLFAFSDSTHLNFPNDLAFDSTGRLFVSDGGTQLVDVFSINYDQTTPANSTATFLFDLSQDNMPGTLSQFLAPSGLAFDSAGQLLVTTGTYNPDDPSQPLLSTQYVLVLDRPSLAIT
ncbi:MAG TPA: NHL repeat-containing protein, partial [Vicinamibacterales bacterium]